MMKRNDYNVPEVEIIVIETSDIITTSPSDKPFVGTDDNLN